MACSVATQRLEQQGPEGASRVSMGVLYSTLVDVFNGEAAPQHLDKHFPELSGGEVVEEWVEDRTKVEEGVCHRVEDDVVPEVGRTPLRLWQSSHHKTTNLVRKPAHHQGSHNKT